MMIIDNKLYFWLPQIIKVPNEYVNYWFKFELVYNEYIDRFSN